jgi:hypothetical protein
VAWQSREGGYGSLTCAARGLTQYERALLRKDSLRSFSVPCKEPDLQHGVIDPASRHPSGLATARDQPVFDRVCSRKRDEADIALASVICELERGTFVIWVLG